MSRLERVMRWSNDPGWHCLVLAVWAMWQAGCAEPSQESPRIVTAEIGSSKGQGNGGQAFPDLMDGWNESLNAENGISKLDFFAATAPPRACRGCTMRSAEEDAKLEAEWRYLYAKEMLRERAKQ